MVFLVVFLEGFKNPPTSSPPPTGAPIRLPTGPNVKTNPPISVNKNSTQKLLEVMKNRPTPSVNADKTIRERLIDQAVANNGVVEETGIIKIEYLDSPNTFEVLLKQYPLAPGKNAAYSFFRSEGMTDDGICKLPLSFYLTSDVSQRLKEAGEEFSPYPEFCL